MSDRVVVRTVEVTTAVSREIGPVGKSAYQSYLATTTDDPPMTEAEWAAGGGNGTVDAAAIAAIVHAADAKGAPVDADEIGLADSAASFGWKKFTWAAIKSTLGTYFSTIFQGKITAPGDIGAATAAQGAKADSAVQPDDLLTANVSHADTAATAAATAALTNGTISGTLTAGTLTTDATTKANLRNAAGLGTGDSPTLTIVNASTGFYGADARFVTTSGGVLLLANTFYLTWSSSTPTSTKDTSLSRLSAGLLGIGTGANGSFAGSLKLANLICDNTVQLKSFTVATVPSASISSGSTIYVSNESGGAVLCFSDGTNWRRVTDRAIIS
jgi:hypothetical protein